ncbi:MAG TPA: competence/damage-inducible protein A [Thermohalobaculum sp.]|nr:competence/damage-inducible protein A [Thermohalobaculum sp.]
MPQPTAAALVIGDEILSGRTRDSNAHHLAGRLAGHGIRLVEIRVVPDDVDIIAAAVRTLSGRVDHLFTSGGIGPTHDDVTADAVARAFGQPLDVRPDARAILERHYGAELNAARLRMARVPEGAALIENPVSAAPGFSLGNVHVMAGVPQIFEAMLAGLLPRLAGGPPLLSRSLRADAPEGEIAEALSGIAGRWPQVSIGCYPSFRSSGPSVAVILRAEDAEALDRAAEAAEAALARWTGAARS